MVPGAALDRKVAQRGDGFRQRRLAVSVLAHEKAIRRGKSSAKSGRPRKPNRLNGNASASTRSLATVIRLRKGAVRALLRFAAARGRKARAAAHLRRERHAVDRRSRQRAQIRRPPQ
jgi:hypothetical protein